jgi:hypothetical protein
VDSLAVPRYRKMFGVINKRVMLRVLAIQENKGTHEFYHEANESMVEM